MRKDPGTIPEAESDMAADGSDAETSPSTAQDGESVGAVLDCGMLEQLQELQLPGQPNILQRVVALYLQNSPAQLKDLQEAVQTSDLNNVRRLAHSMKMTSATVGARRLASLFRELEAKGREGKGWNRVWRWRCAGSKNTIQGWPENWAC